MSLYTEAPVPLVARLIRDRLAADSELTGFFGARIVTSPLEEADIPIRYPTLAVVPIGDADRTRRGGPTAAGRIHSWFIFLVRAYLPAPTPASEGLRQPAAPTLHGTATGPLTGTFRYRLTEITVDGESFAGPDSTALSVTVSAKAPTLTMPAASTGGLGFRVWRTSQAYPRRYNLCGLALTPTWTDTVPDTALRDELAPDSDFGHRLLSYVESVLTGTDKETLPEGGVYHANAALNVTPGKPTLLTKRNLILYSLEARYPTLFDPSTMEIAIGA